MRSNTINIKPELLTWARERSGIDFFMLKTRFPKIAEWEAGTSQPTLRQLENFAHAVHIPFGYLFLPEPVQESIPVPDFRTLSDKEVKSPSPDLLDTLYLCQQRQDWYREYTRLHSIPPLDYIGTATLSDDPVQVADNIRARLNLSITERQQLPTWTEALRQFLNKVEESGVLVMASSIVGSNTHRKLDVDEFRGFALSDDRAALVFLNASDSKSAQMFTLAHEMAHLWLGQSGVFDTVAGRIPGQNTERWCNAVAAELLMPLKTVQEEYSPDNSIEEEIQRLARIYKVSTLVVLRRLFDAGFINEGELSTYYKEELERIRNLELKKSNGGDFYRTLGVRTGKRFARAVVSSALEGQTLFQDAFRMLGVRKSATFYQVAHALGVLP